ncbi:hypothetical protein E3Q23_03354 [Wallemia mellicola]|nr:hypothetical protein E3Q23_03354 [Wallemia mellicola]
MFRNPVQSLKKFALKLFYRTSVESQPILEELSFLTYSSPSLNAIYVDNPIFKHLLLKAIQDSDASFKSDNSKKSTRVVKQLSIIPEEQSAEILLWEC